MNIYDLTRIHGSNVVRDAMRIVTCNALKENDVMLFPMLYRVIYRGQSTKDLYLLFKEIQSYTCCKDFS